MKGSIVRKRDEGYGFIKPAEGEKDVFFHATAVAEGYHFDDFSEGDTVEFDLEEGPKGPAAANVTKSDDAAAADDASGDMADEAANDNAAPAEDDQMAA